MRISTFGYSMKQGVKNIGRNKMFSLASVATMAACIFVFGLFFAIVQNFSYIVHKAEESVAITISLMRTPRRMKSMKFRRSWKVTSGVR